MRAIEAINLQNGPLPAMVEVLRERDELRRKLASVNAPVVIDIGEPCRDAVPVLRLETIRMHQTLVRRWADRLDQLRSCAIGDHMDYLSLAGVLTESIHIGDSVIEFITKGPESC